MENAMKEKIMFTNVDVDRQTDDALDQAEDTLQLFGRRRLIFLVEKLRHIVDDLQHPLWI